jgi:elongation factor P--beta-lysine ligase
LIQAFRQKLLARGARSVFGLEEIFRNIDENGNGSLDLSEFARAVLG